MKLAPIMLYICTSDAPPVARARVGGLLAQLRIPVDENHSKADAHRPQAVLIVADNANLFDCCSRLKALRAQWPGIAIAVFIDRLDPGAALRLSEAGAADFACLTANDDELLVRMRRTVGLPLSERDDPANLATAYLIEAKASPARVELPAIGVRLIGRCPAFLRMLARLPALARCDASVLLLGETGTGKEVCARAIHYSSARAQGPWVAVNCAAIPAELVEDELFGHVRGAYTHAVAARCGLVQEAEGGTLLFDEIDSLPLSAQAKLLRFLQDKEFRPVGSSRLQRANVRVIAASNRDLRLAVQQGRFREDLYFRLNVLTLTLPPLRERNADIPALAQAFFEEFQREASSRLDAITPSAMQRLLEHDWPGNVRELRHTVQRAVLLASGPSIGAADIELSSDSDAAPPAVEAKSFREAKARAVEAFERGYLERMLLGADGNISLAARTAKKNRRAFFELLRRHSIDAARYRSSAS